MKLVVTGTRGIPDIMGGVETHCEYFRIAARWTPLSSAAKIM